MALRTLLVLSTVAAALVAPASAWAVSVAESKPADPRYQTSPSAAPQTAPSATEAQALQRAGAEPSALLLGLAAVVGIGYVVGRRSGRD